MGYANTKDPILSKPESKAYNKEATEAKTMLKSLKKIKSVS